MIVEPLFRCRECANQKRPRLPLEYSHLPESAEFVKAAVELITEEEFAKRLGVSGEWIAMCSRTIVCHVFWNRVKSNFSQRFYGDITIDRHELGEVSVLLGNLASASKYDFFISRSTFLLTKTPLEALRDGLLTTVLMPADGLANR